MAKQKWICYIHLTKYVIHIKSAQNKNVFNPRSPLHLWLFEVHPCHAFDVFDILSKRIVYQEPLHISIFRPLSISIAAAIGVIFFGDALYLGRHRIISLSLITFSHFWELKIWIKLKKQLIFAIIGLYLFLHSSLAFFSPYPMLQCCCYNCLGFMLFYRENQKRR